MESTVLMTKAEACAYLGICSKTMSDLVREKKIPVVRLTQKAHPRFRRESLDKWLESREQQVKVIEYTGPTLRKRRNLA